MIKATKSLKCASYTKLFCVSEHPANQYTEMCGKFSNLFGEIITYHDTVLHQPYIKSPV